MAPSRSAVLDACVLAPFSLCDLFLRLAEEPRLYRPRWTMAILAEVRRTQTGKLGWPERLAGYWQEQVTESFPEALVTGHEPLLERCRNAEEDRHVLAAAIRASAPAIVTFNLRHFPALALEPWGIAAHHPADYLAALYDEDPVSVMGRVAGIAERRKLEPIEVLRRLRGLVARFARHVAAREGLALRAARRRPDGWRRV